MADKVGWINRAFLLFNNEIPPDCPEGSIWTNLTEEELYFCLSSGQQAIPHSGYHRCSLTKSVDQTIPDVIWTEITFDQENFDVGGLHDILTNNERITIQKDGDYRIIYQIRSDTKDKSRIETRVYKNGSSVVEGTCNVSVGSKDASEACLNLISPLISFIVDDYLTLQVFQDSGGNQDVKASNTFFGIQRLF